MTESPHIILKASLDRLHEIHWYIHLIEFHYHDPNGFRYSLNGYIRSLKELPKIISMELQNSHDYQASFKPQLKLLREDSLFSILSEKRDFVVHQGMLNLLSSGTIGATRDGENWKIVFPFPVSPQESSDRAYERIKQLYRTDQDVRTLLEIDDEYSLMIRREWKIKEFNKDLLDIVVEAWKTSGKVLSKIIEKLGGRNLDISLSCRHHPEQIRRKIYSQEDFFQSIDINTSKK